MTEKVEHSTHEMLETMKRELEIFFENYFSKDSLNKIKLQQLYNIRYHPGTAQEKLGTLSPHFEGKEINSLLDNLIIQFATSALNKVILIELLNNFIDYFILSYLEKTTPFGIPLEEQFNIVKNCLQAPQTIYIVRFVNEQKPLQLQSFKILEEQLYNYIRRIYYLEKYGIALTYFGFHIDGYTVLPDMLASKLEFEQQLRHLRNESIYKYKITSLGITEVLSEVHSIFKQLLALAQIHSLQEITENAKKHFSFLNHRIGNLQMDYALKLKMEEELHALLPKIYVYFHNGEITEQPEMEEEMNL